MSQGQIDHPTYVTVDPTTPLATTAVITTGDIEIGAVELKNGTTDQRAVIDGAGALNVVAAALPLPSGASTSAAQTTAQTSLTTLAGQAASVVTGQGRKVTTTAGTPVALATTTPCKWVLATALTANTQQVNVGLTGVIAASGTSTGVPLVPGAAVLLPIADVATLFVDSRVNAEGVSYVYGV